MGSLLNRPEYNEELPGNHLFYPKVARLIASPRSMCSSGITRRCTPHSVMHPAQDDLHWGCEKPLITNIPKVMVVMNTCYISLAV